MKHNIGIMQGRLTPSKGRGIQFFPFENWKNEFGIAKEIGLDEIEFIFDYNDYECNPLWTEEGIGEIETLIHESGVSVRSVCFDYFMRRPFYKYSGTEQDEVREENTRIITRVLHTMKMLGIDLIEIPSVDNSSMKNDTEKLLYKEWLSGIASVNPDICFGMETDLPPRDFLNFIESINLPNVGANYDSGNSSGIGYNMYEEVTTLGNHIFNIHIKDRKYRGTTMQLGTGSADFEGLFRGLNEINYNHSFILQAARGEDYKEVENIKWQKRFIEELIKKYLVKKDV